MPKTLWEIIRKQMRDPKFRAEWEALEKEFGTIRAMIDEQRKKYPTQYIQVGKYIPATAETVAQVDRDYYRQGWIFKDEEAFLHDQDQVCYVPELSDEAYTRRDFLRICGGDEELAKICFYNVDWQSPETWMDEYEREEADENDGTDEAAGGCGVSERGNVSSLH